MRIEFRVVFRNGGVACDPFATYSDSALHAALMSALPEGMTGNLMPSTDSKGQPAVLVRAQASDINTMYELRSQVVSGDFMSALTRHLRSHVKSERRSQRLEISKRADAGQSTTGMPEPPAKDADLDSMEAGANEMTIMEEETVWEKIRLLLPWQNDEDKADAEMKSTKRELQQARQALKERRQQVAELEARCNELTEPERLATMSKEDCPASDAIESIPPPAAPVEEKYAEPVAEAPAAAVNNNPTAANYVALEELTPEQWQKIKDLKAAYLAAGGELDEYGDIFILRFLVDKDWKYEKALKKAKSTAAWRAKSGVNGFRKQIASGLVYNEIPNIKELFTTVAVSNAHSRTKAGDLMTFIDYGSLDVNKFFKLLDNSQYFDINNFILEYVSYHSDKLTQETGALVRQFMVIDAGGIGLAHVSLRMFIRFKPIMPLADLYYPELLGGARVLNAAWALHQGWKLVKPLLSKQIQDMVGILDCKHTPGALLKVADPEAVPDFYGGTCTTIPRPAVDWYPKAGMEGVDAAAICPGKKLGAYMRRTLAPDGAPLSSGTK